WSAPSWRSPVCSWRRGRPGQVLLGLRGRLGLCGGRRLGLVVALKALHLVDELADVLELPVDRSEAHVGHGVELLEVLHHDLPELLARDLLLGAIVELRLDLANDVVDRLDADRPLLARFQNRGAELLAVEGLAPAVPLDDVRQDILDVLVGRVPPVALEALTPAPDELALAPDPRVDDPILRVTAKRAFHRR